MNFIFANIRPDDLVYGIIGVLVILCLLAVIIYLFDRSGGYF